MTHIDGLLRLAHEQNPDPPGGWPAATKRSTAVNLLPRIEAHRADYLRFTLDSTSPSPTTKPKCDTRSLVMSGLAGRRVGMC